MRFGLAAKLSLLAALLVFGTTVLAGTIFFRSARSVVRGREAAGLQDEAELCRRELLSELDRGPADLLALAGAPAARALLARPTDADDRRRFENAGTRLLEARPHYLELAVVAVADVREVARIDRTADGPHAALATALRGWNERPELALKNGLAPPAVGFSAVPADPAKGPAVEQTLVTPVAGPDGRAIGWVFLRFDFAALAARLNRSPRLLGFLINRDGFYLAHPDAGAILSGHGDSPLDHAFDRLKPPVAGTARVDDVSMDSLTLPGLMVYDATVRFPTPPESARLRPVRDELVKKYPELRIGRVDDPADRLVFRAADPDKIRQAIQDLRGRLEVPVEADDPYKCVTFFARLLPVQAETPPVRAPVPPAAATTPPWFGLALAAAHEEIEHDIVADYWRNFLYSALLAAAAGCGMLAFALFMTGSLRRMTAYAERVAAGSDALVDLPDPSGRDEIGTLARAFRRMVEQVRLRTRELRESEARIRTILNTAAEGIVTIDEKGQLESFNQAAERIFGYPAADVRGQHFRKLLFRGRPGESGDSEVDLPSLLGTSLAAGSGGGTESSLMSISRVNNTTREVVGRRRNGQPFPVEMSVSEVVLGDRLVYTAIMRDITDRKQAESQIQRMTGELERRVRERTAELVQANQALETARDLALEANRAKDAFLAVMSHELRTPLNAIIGYCDYWLHEAEEHDPTEMLDDLRKMHVSGRHLLTLINDILDLAKIQAGKMVLEMGEFDLPPLLDELKEWVEPLVQKNGNTLTVDAAAKLGLIRADRTRVRQVLLNLLSNAAKFTKDGAIRLQALRRIGGGRSEEVVFRVTDTGVGMKSEDVKRLFQPFVQVDSSSTRKHEGTGLGLAICRKLCELMGGAIEVDSQPGIGTTFTVRLPASVGPPQLPGAPLAELPSRSDRATVLVVDDQPRTRELLERLLAKDGYHVLTAPGGAAGLDVARTARPSAVILDALSAGRGGWAVLGALKSDPATADIPVVMATVVDGHTRGVALGATEYVAKPIDWARLGVILRAYRSEPRAEVLLVEDDVATREVTARTLRGQGWEVREAGDGAEALAKVREATPAVILLDLMMPTMDGFEFVEELWREPAWRAIPVVVVTAADLSDADRARLAGSVQQVLQKGTTTPGQLLAEIRARVLQRVVAEIGPDRT
jgi:signal transduction histidine kinase/DNA-binding response OmpR family regulator/HAMP domain-containing protein